jgi:hypothetical protein
LAGVVPFHRKLAVHHGAFRPNQGEIPQHPAQRPEHTPAVSHWLHRDGNVHDRATAAAELDREVSDLIAVALPQPVHHRAELPAVLTGHIGRQRLADQEPLVDVEQRRRRSVGLEDPGRRVGDQVGDRGELEQRLVAFTIGLQGLAGRGQLGCLLVQLLAGDRQLLDGLVQLGQRLGQQPASWLAAGCRAPLQLGDPVAGAAQLPGERIVAVHTASSLHLAVWTTAASRSRPVVTIGCRYPDRLDARGRLRQGGLKQQ